jgi:hypothetical protein
MSASPTPRRARKAVTTAAAVVLTSASLALGAGILPASAASNPFAHVPSAGDGPFSIQLVRGPLESPVKAVRVDHGTTSLCLPFGRPGHEQRTVTFGSQLTEGYEVTSFSDFHCSGGHGLAGTSGLVKAMKPSGTVYDISASRKPALHF